MTSVDSAGELVFEPPGPGSWNLDATHFPRPATRYWTEMQPEPLKQGFQEFTRYYGMLIDGLEYGYVNGFAYSSVRPAPPKQISERMRRAEAVFEGKLWRDQLRDWDETFKPASIKRSISGRPFSFASSHSEASFQPAAALASTFPELRTLVAHPGLSGRQPAGAGRARPRSRE